MTVVDWLSHLRPRPALTDLILPYEDLHSFSSLTTQATFFRWVRRGHSSSLPRRRSPAGRRHPSQPTAFEWLPVVPIWAAPPLRPPSGPWRCRRLLAGLAGPTGTCSAP